MKLIVAILVALGLGWLVDMFRRKSVSAPGLDGEAPPPSEPLSTRIADAADAAMGTAAGAGVKAAGAVQRAAPGAADAASASVDTLSGAAQAAAGKASDVAAAATDKASNVASTAADKASDAAAMAADTLAGAAASAAAQLPGPAAAAVDKASAAAASAAQAASGAAAAAASRLPGGGAGDLTSAQETFGEPLPATPPAGERPLAAPLRPDEADVRSALAEPTPEAIEVFDEDRDAIALRAPQAGAVPGESGAAAGATAMRESAAGAAVPAGAVAGDGTYHCPSGYPIKGNAGSRIYHTPGSRSYEQTIPEFCFTTAAAAEAAGFRAAQGAASHAATGESPRQSQSNESEAGASTAASGMGAAAHLTSTGGGSGSAAAAPAGAVHGAASRPAPADGQTLRPPSGAVAGDGTHRCPPGYPVKGNASSRIFHVPGSSSYDQTIPEFCFDSSASAEAAGFRAPKR
ncbi:MAG TPA: hypothetical protein VFQ80_09945 [Thermomicrobiales bacterium]|nr:hypothetical protein [Thermomicrobiales bacterium]